MHGMLMCDIPSADAMVHDLSVHGRDRDVHTEVKTWTFREPGSSVPRASFSVDRTPPSSHPQAGGPVHRLCSPCSGPGTNAQRWSWLLVSPEKKKRRVYYHKLCCSPQTHGYLARALSGIFKSSAPNRFGPDMASLIACFL